MFKKEYKISIDQDDWVTPEETLMDSSSEHSDLEKPITSFVFRFLLFAFLAIFLVVFAFCIKIAFFDHNLYSDLAYQNKTVNFLIPPPRGLIYDKFGKILVKNIPSFDLLVVGKELHESQNETDIAKVAKILGQNPSDFEKIVDNQLKQNSIFFAAKDLSKDKILAINFLNPKGFHVITNSKRQYIDGNQFSQVVGYASKVNQDDLSDSYYSSADIVGRSGIEGQYEEILRGEHGRIFFSREGEESQSKEPIIGKSVVLNIDYDLQKELFNDLTNILAGTGVNKAAAVVQNPQTGEVLAMVSLPSFDNNIFTSAINESDYKSIFENKSKPLFNRAISGLYNPGSTIKPMMGLMTLQEGIFSSTDNIKDCIEITIPNPFKPDSPYIYKNSRPVYGPINLRKAIAISCNIYFFIAGGGYKDIQGLGVNRITKYLSLAKADSILGIDLPGEEKGFVPTPEWKEKTKNEIWYTGDTYNISIGQGDLLLTPLWLNTYVSAVANGGKIYKPLVANRIMDQKNNVSTVFKPEVIATLPFKEDIIKEVRNDMEETVLTGTARLLQNIPVSVGAKTGTAEIIKGKINNSVFIAFAPVTNAEVSITVLIEGSPSERGFATKTADEFLKSYFAIKQKRAEAILPSSAPKASVMPSNLPSGTP